MTGSMTMDTNLLIDHSNVNIICISCPSTTLKPGSYVIHSFTTDSSTPSNCPASIIFAVADFALANGVLMVYPLAIVYCLKLFDSLQCHRDLEFSLF